MNREPKSVSWRAGPVCFSRRTTLPPSSRLDVDDVVGSSAYAAPRVARKSLLSAPHRVVPLTVNNRRPIVRVVVISMPIAPLAKPPLQILTSPFSPSRSITLLFYPTF
jgi:hypothetical protein